MAGTWRVAIDSIEDLGNPSYRVGDFTKKLVSTIRRRDEEPELKHVVLEACVGDVVQRSRTFDVTDPEAVVINQVLFVQKPTVSQRLILRVVRAHRVQKDALIGEAEVKAPVGPMRLELVRGKKARGTLVVSVTDGIPDRNSASPSPKPMPSSRSQMQMPGAASGNDLASLVQSTPRSVQNFLASATCSPGSVGMGSPFMTPATRAPPKSALATATSTATGCLLGCWEGLLDLVGAGSVEAAGRRFLAAKVREEGVVRLRSGLMYKVLRKGEGRRHPTKDTPCEVHYRGTLVNGREFDSSKGKPVTFTLSQVIKGWAEALQLMVEGDYWELYVPPSLAYGDKGAGGVIPSGATLVFQVELVRIKNRVVIT